jgi:cell shape-determining protein MreC
MQLLKDNPKPKSDLETKLLAVIALSAVLAIWVSPVFLFIAVYVLWHLSLFTRLTSRLDASITHFQLYHQQFNIAINHERQLKLQNRPLNKDLLPQVAHSVLTALEHPSHSSTHQPTQLFNS